MILRKPVLAALGLVSLVAERLVPEPEHIARERLRQIALEETHHVLHDIEWRYHQARDLLAEVAGVASGNVVPIGSGRQITAEDINDLRHRLTGYTVTANSPAAGSIAWAALRIVYGGVDYVVADGNTANKYVWFVKPATGTAATLSTGNTKPTLGPDDLLVFVNNGGTPTIAASDGSASLPSVVGTNAVDFDAIANSAVSGDKIATAGIGTGKLGTGAISASGMFGTNVVTTNAINAGAVTSNELGGNSVISGKIADGAVNTAAKLANGIVVADKIGAGAVAPTKLNILSHVLY